MQYSKGDYIRYSQNGVCYIEDIKQMKNPVFQNGLKQFYVLKPVGNEKSTVYVPTDNTELTSRMIYILKKQDIDSLIDSVKKSSLEWIDVRRLRAESFKKIIKTSDQQELLKLVSCIYLKKQEWAAAGKKLSATDDGILKQAEELIDNEFTFVLGLKKGQVGEYIRNRLGIDKK